MPGIKPVLNMFSSLLPVTLPILSSAFCPQHVPLVHGRADGALLPVRDDLFSFRRSPGSSPSDCSLLF